MLKVAPFLPEAKVPSWLRLGSLPPNLRVSAAVRTAAQKKQRESFEFEIRELQHQVQKDIEELAAIPEGMNALRQRLQTPMPAPPSETKWNEGEAVAGLLGLLKGEAQQTNRMLYGKARARQADQFETDVRNRDWQRKLDLEDLDDLESRGRSLERRIETGRAQSSRLGQAMQDLDADTLDDLLRLYERGASPTRSPAQPLPTSKDERIVGAYWKQLERGASRQDAERSALAVARQYQAEEGWPEESTTPLDVLQAAKSVRIRASEYLKNSSLPLPKALADQASAAKNVLFHELVTAEDSLQKARTDAEKVALGKRVTQVQRVIDESEQAELSAQLEVLNRIPSAIQTQEEKAQIGRIQTRIRGIESRLKNPPKEVLPVSNPARTNLKTVVGSWMGVPYKWGGTSRSGVDCSAFTQSVLGTQGKHIPRTAEAQYRDASGKSVAWKELQPGDVLYFHKTTRAKDPGRASHCGIYMGNGQFAHASSGRGVTMTSLENKYYKSRFLGAKRFSTTNR